MDKRYGRVPFLARGIACTMMQKSSDVCREENALVELESISQNACKKA